MDYVFKIYLRTPKRIVRRIHKHVVPRRKAKRIVYNPYPSKNMEDYECGFSFPVKLVYSNKLIDDDLEF